MLLSNFDGSEIFGSHWSGLLQLAWMVDAVEKHATSFVRLHNGRAQWDKVLSGTHETVLLGYRVKDPSAFLLANRHHLVHPYG